MLLVLVGVAPVGAGFANARSSKSVMATTLLELKWHLIYYRFFLANRYLESGAIYAINSGKYWSTKSITF